MFRKDRTFAGPTLPRTLLDKFDTVSKKPNGRKPPSLSRKDRRKTDRDQKKFKKHGHLHTKRVSEPAAEEDSTGSSDYEMPLPPERTGPKNVNAIQSVRSSKSILKTSVSRTDPEIDKEDSLAPLVSKRKNAKRDADDAEIAALEKKLGMKSQKLPKSFHDDGLGDLIEGLDKYGSDEGGSPKRKRDTEDEKWLENKRKRRKDQMMGNTQSNTHRSTLMDEPTQSEGSEDGDTSLDATENEDDNESATDLQSDKDEFDGFEAGSPTKLPRKQIRENPYIPPPTSGIDAPAKYIPPSRRAPLDDAELNQRLRRQMQGLLNRLSDANLLSIVNEAEKLYQSYPRQYVTATLVDLLMTLLCDHASLNDTFLILHAGFMTAMYKVVGPDFGAQALEHIVLKADYFYSKSTSHANNGKEIVNLISLLAHLFNFQVISSDVVFDYIRIFLSSLTELHTELLLRIVRTSGSQFRQEDPSSLKDIALLLQNTVAATPNDQVSVRTQFMIEMINDLKNNRLKTGVAGSVISSEHITRMRKTLGSLHSSGTIRATEPLRVPLEDVRNAEKKGKWWLVGASWKGNSITNTNTSFSSSKFQTQTELSSTQEPTASDVDLEDPTARIAHDLHTFAHQNGMNNPLRRSIFSALIAASDYRDSHTRLLKLHLSRTQEREIPHVLLHCVGAEKGYNPYYGLVARQLCMRDKKIRVAFQFALWDFLKRIGADASAAAAAALDADSDDDHDSDVKLHMVVNTAKLYGSLLAAGVLSILILKPIDAAALALPLGSRSRARSGGKHGIKRPQGSKASTFLEVLIITLFSSIPKAQPDTKPSAQSYQTTAVYIDGDEAQKLTAEVVTSSSIFCPALGQPALAVGLRAFITRIVAASNLVSGRKERRRIEVACEAVDGLLSAAATSASAEEDEASDIEMEDEYGDLDVDWDEED